MKKMINKILGYFKIKIIRVNNNQNPLSNKSSISQEFFFNGNANEPYNELPFAGESMEKLITDFSFDTILDIGSGEGKHSDMLESKGKKVTSIDFGKSIYFEKRTDNHTCIFGDYYDYNFEEQFDAIWASHVLEHQPNPNLFLKKIHKDLKEGGVLSITVPPLKHDIVGGHVTVWNAGLLMYQLVIAGFDCRDIAIKAYGYNIGILLKKKSILNYPDLSYDSGDIMKLSEFFPLNITEPFNGDIKELNWY